MSKGWRAVVVTAAAAGAMMIGWRLAVRPFQGWPHVGGGRTGSRTGGGWKSFRWGRRGTWRTDARPTQSQASGADTDRSRSHADEIEALDDDQKEQMLRELSGLL